MNWTLAMALAVAAYLICLGAGALGLYWRGR